MNKAGIDFEAERAIDNQLSLNGADLIQLDRDVGKVSFSEFLKSAWPEIVVDTFVPGWHIDAMADHLQACADGDIKRLLINVPPGSSKSTITSVFFPAWLWGPYGWPTAKFIGCSYESDLATRDNRYTRALIDSEWYQDRWATYVRSDENKKTAFENSKGGYRQSSSVRGMTGKRGDFIVWDDPLNPTMADSDTLRNGAIRIFRETLPLRLSKPKKSVIIVVMQRLHENDVSGHILESDYGYEHLMIPMEFDSKRIIHTCIGWTDPRKKDGQLLCPARWDRKTIDRDKKVLGTYGASGQLQQLPSPRGGGLFQKGDFEIVGAAAAGCTWVRGWDLAGSDPTETGVEPAYTAGVLMGKSSDGTFYIQDATRIQGTAGKVDKLLKNTATQDDADFPGNTGSIPQDPGSAGKDRATAIIKHLAGHNYRKSPESGDKVTRALPMSAQAEAGNIKIVKGAWNKDFLDEITTFPVGKFKDQVDAATRAFNILNSAPKPFEWYAGGKTHTS